MNLKPLVCALALACVAHPLHAAEQESAPEKTGKRDEPAQQLEHITILGEREALPRIAGSAHFIDEVEMQRYAYDDINRVLNVVPGVYVREEDGFGLRPNIGLRGGSSDRSQKVTLLEDGVLFGPAPYSAPAAYFFPLSARMTGVEVFKGPAAISQGPQTIGGAINLLSAPVPEATEGFVEAAGGSDGYRRGHLRAGGVTGGFGLLGELVHVGSDGFKELDGGGDTGFTKNEAMIKARHAIGPGVLELRLAYADEVSDETYLGLTEDDFRNAPYRRYRASSLDEFDWDWNSIRADWQQALLGGELIATVYNYRFDRAWRKFNNFGGGTQIREVLANPDSPSNRLFYGVLTGEFDGDPGFEGDDLLIGTNDRQFRSSGVQARQTWRLDRWGGEHRIELGTRLHSDRAQRLHDEFAYEMQDGELVRNTLPRRITTDNTGRTTALAAWLRDEARYGRWTIAPGVRIEQVASEFTDRLAGLQRDNDYAVVLPGLGVSYALTPALNLLAGVHRGFSPATVGPSEDIEPEKAISYEAGGRWRSAFGSLELIGFYNDYSDYIVTCTFSAGCPEQRLDELTNVGQVEIYGLETGYVQSWALVADLRLLLQGSYTWTHAEFRNRFTSKDPQLSDSDNEIEIKPGFELPYVPEHRANARLSLDATRWSLALSATYQSRMRDFAGEGEIEPGTGSDSFTVLDLAGHWDLTPAWSLSARADNLLDREYVVSRRPFGARPGKPLSAQLGVKYRF